MKSKSSPALFGLRVLRKFLPDSEKDFLVNSMEEYYQEMCENKGVFYAHLWSWKEIVFTVINIVKDNAYRSLIMFINYVKIALRLMKKNPSYSLINISGLVAGITSCIFIFIWVNNELSYENTHENAKHIYRLLLKRADGHPSGPRVSTYTAPGLKDFILINYPSIKSAARFTFSDPGTRPEILVSYERDQYHSKNFGFADPEIFDLFSIRFLSGSKESALINPNSIILTKSMADRFFPDENPMGKIIHVENRFTYTVEGVIEDPVNNTHLQYDSLIPFVNITAYMPNYGNFIERLDLQFFNNYILVEKNADIYQVADKFYNFYKSDIPNYSEGAFSNYKYEFLIQPIEDIHLKSSSLVDREKRGNINNVYIFSLSGILILLIAGINFTNLTTAKSAMRAREVGMRKTLGAFRSDLIGQFFGESISYAMIAFVISLTILFAFRPFFESATNISFSLSKLENMIFLIKMFFVVLGIGLLSGLYPSLYLSSFKPVQVLKGVNKSGENRGLFRKILVVSQFVISIALVICAGIIFNQNEYILNKDIGYEKDFMIYSKLSSRLKENYSLLKEKLLREAVVKNVTFSSNTQFPGSAWNSEFFWEGKEPGSIAIMSHVVVDEDFLETFGIEISEGNTFSDNSNSSPGNEYIINETAARTIGISPVVGLEAYPGSDNPPKIIGVVKDYHFNSLHRKIGPLVMFIDPDNFRYAHIRINSENSNQAIAQIESIFRELDSEVPFEYKFIIDTFNNEYNNEKKAGDYLIIFTLLSIFTTCLGLYGLTSFSIENRVKEIGIRKVFGAKTSSILNIILSEFVILITISNIVAWPIAYYLSDKWLEGFAYRIDMSVGVFIISGIFVFIFAILTVMKQTISAAILNPVDSLKYE